MVVKLAILPTVYHIGVIFLIYTIVRGLQVVLMYDSAADNLHVCSFDDLPDPIKQHALELIQYALGKEQQE